MKIEVDNILEGIKDLRKDGAYIRKTRSHSSDQFGSADTATVYYPNKDLELYATNYELQKIYDVFIGDTELVKGNFYDFVMYVYIMKELHK